MQYITLPSQCLDLNQIDPAAMTLYDRKYLFDTIPITFPGKKSPFTVLVIEQQGWPDRLFLISMCASAAHDELAFFTRRRRIYVESTRTHNGNSG